MSFLNAGREIQRFIIDQTYRTPEQEAITAILRARGFNSTIREDDITIEEGKLRKLKISYYPIRCDVVSDTRIETLCATGTQAEPIQEWFTLEDFTETNIQTLSVGDLRLVDGNYTISQHALAQINATMGAAEVALARQITAKIVANKGLHVNGSEFGDRITMSNTSTGVITPLGYWQISKEQHDGAFENVFILGSTEVWNWKQAFAIADVNTTLGQNFAKAAIPNLYYDINLNSIMGVGVGDPEYILTYDPQALKFVSYNRNAGIFATSAMGPQDFDRVYKAGNDNVIKGVFRSARYDILWDFFARFDPCGGNGIDGAWSWYLSLQWDIYFPKIQVCNVQGVNGIMLYKTCVPVIPDCPEGDPQGSPAVAAATYSYNPGSIFPLLVSEIDLGGNLSYPNTLVANRTELAALFNEAYNGQPIFSVSGSNIQYTGYSAITGQMNAETYTITFA